MRNVGLDEAGIKIAGRNINNFRYANDTTLMAESEELKSLFLFFLLFKMCFETLLIFIYLFFLIFIFSLVGG